MCSLKEGCRSHSLSPRARDLDFILNRNELPTKKLVNIRANYIPIYKQLDLSPCPTNEC